MEIGIHAPSWPVVIVSLLLAILALIGYFSWVPRILDRDLRQCSGALCVMVRT